MNIITGLLKSFRINLVMVFGIGDSCKELRCNLSYRPCANMHKKQTLD